mmetsp:Transcript_51008/g.74611  ORF Transcript_51008/g.74611 Transcript_51008/m.74611 type:complete len:216 (-) Transcript_51008:36-683(-)
MYRFQKELLRIKPKDPSTVNLVTQFSRSCSQSILNTVWWNPTLYNLMMKQGSIQEQEEGKDGGDETVSGGDRNPGPVSTIQQQKENQGNEKCTYQYTDTVILLTSSYCSDQVAEGNQRRLRTLLDHRNIEYQEVDGAAPENKTMRDQLFEISQSHGVYPQTFMIHDGDIFFIGLWDQIEQLNECNDLPEEFIASNPDVQTFDNVFKYAFRKASGT